MSITFTVHAQKVVYIPNSWRYNATTGEYTEDGNKLGFSSSNMLNKYKILILMNYTTTWTCYGAGYDFEAAAPYRDNYIGKFDYRAVQLGNNKYQVAYASAPQGTGFNVGAMTNGPISSNSWAPQPPALYPTN